MARKKNNLQWWSEEYGFFGDFYVKGDNSKEGYLIQKKQNLEQRTLAEVNGILNILNLEPNSQILDCPCGYGRHSIELSRGGFSLTGLDINSKHLKIAKKEAERDSLEIEFVKKNMQDINYNLKFDAIINIFYSFGFFEREEDNFKVLKSFYKALKPGGKFLMHTDVNVPRIYEGKYKLGETRTLSNENSLKIVEKYDPITKRIDGSWIIKDKEGNKTRKDYSVRVYTKEEYIELSKKAGFKSYEVYSDWDKKPYSKTSEDMIVVFNK